ncbi:MAG: penicillin-binding transpeptidase domain-containing protein, partial [Syntrophomonadaceae bacterium]|nr:penicillin-binding transpeptidase domain-containing protein [Syntrophomonadaceae bacterium]
MRPHRLFILMFAFLLVFLSLLARFAYFQVVKGQDIAREAIAMRSKQIDLREYQRGEILDRNLLPLTSTENSNALYCFPEEAGKLKTKTVSSYVYQSEFSNDAMKDISIKLSQALENKDDKEILQSLNYAEKNGAAFVRIAEDLTSEQINRVNSLNQSGIVIAPLSKRYRQDGFCSHILGYLSQGVNSEGQAGIEKLYEHILRQNSPSQSLTSVIDARGIAIQGLMYKVRQQENEQRSAVVLTIDKRLQEIVENKAKNIKKGAIVVMDVRNKEVLAMVSRPAFNPNDDLANLIKNDKESTLSNRALSKYHPGSLFKILLAAAALEEKKVRLDDEFYCNGKYVFNDEVAISCWKEEGHGKIDFAEGFAISCNPAFIKAGLKLGKQSLLEYVEKMHRTDGRLLGYSNHSDSYVKIEPGEPALGNACLGQEGVMITPLQMTSLLATIADDGKWAPPSLLCYTIDSKGKKQNLPEIAKEQVIKQETAKTVQYLMEMVVSDGTGKTAALKEIKAAGKTATSQTGNFKEDGQEILDTWFGGYFPADNPRWAIVVMVEGGQSGAQDAAPVFK